MPEDFISNGPISTPIYIHGLQPDADLNGVMWSQEMGLFFTPYSQIEPLKLPPPFDGGPG